MAKTNSSHQAYLTLNVPNLITGLRIILTLVAIFLLLNGNNIAAGVVITLAWVTDFLDGSLARRLKQATEAGGVLDLVADRLLMMSVLIITFFQGYWTRTTGLMPLNPFPYALTVLAADFILIVGVIVFLTKRRKKAIKFPPPPYLARFTFSVQMATLVIGVLRLGPDWLLAGLMYLAMILTLISAFLYLKTGGYIFTK